MTARRRPAVGLTRERVLGGALSLADRQGLAALSFRKLAAELDVTPMALYRYVGSKEELLDAIGDRVLAELELPAPGLRWDEGLRALARSLRTAVRAHPAAAPLLAARPLFTPAAFRAGNATLGFLRKAGFGPEETVVLYDQFARLVLALITLEVQERSRDDDERRAQGLRARLTLETLPPTEFPHLVEAAPHLGARDAERDFESGLDLLIAGLQELSRRRA